MKIMKSKIILFSATLLLLGCDQSPLNTVLQPVNYQQNVNINPVINNRIKVERLSIVKDSTAYSNERGTYLITDTKTGAEYIGVSGIGITEVGSHSSGKYSTTDER